MATNGNRLISKILADTNLPYALKAGVTKEWFGSTDDRAVWVFMENHFKQYGANAPATTVKRNFPTYTLLKVPDQIDYLIDTLKEEYTNAAVYEMLEEAVNNMGSGSGAVLTTLNQRLDTFHRQTNQSSDLDLPDTSLDQYMEYQSAPQLSGIPTGFSGLDSIINGLHPEQLIVLIAQPKAGKSLLLMQAAINIHQAGHKVLFQSFEMSNKEQRERHDALRAHVSLQNVHTRNLSSTDLQALQKALTALHGAPQGSFVLTDSSEAMTLGQLAAKAAQYGPDVLIVDGVYLMVDEVTGEANTPMAITNITRGFKRMAQRLKTPIIISTQSLISKQVRGQTSMFSAGYASSWAQDADVMLGLDHKTEDNSRRLKIIASRKSGVGEWPLTFLPDSGKIEDIHIVTTGTAPVVSSGAMNMAEGGDDDDES